METQKFHLVAKANTILKHLAFFNLEERRLFDYLLKHYDSRQDAENPLLLKVPIEDFKKLFPAYEGLKNKYVFRACSRAVKGIQAKPAKISEIDQIYWFQRLSLVDNPEGGGKVLVFKLSEDIKPYFLELQINFIKYRIGYTINFKKPTSYTLYEYLKEKYHNGDCKKWVVLVDDLKERLGVGDKYTNRFNNFEIKCLKGPLQEINNYSDISFEYEKIKVGPKVTSLIFQITEIRDFDTITIETEKEGIEKQLLGLGIKAPQVETLLLDLEKSDKMEKAIQELPKIIKAARQEKTKNPAGYTVNSLKNIIRGQEQPPLFTAEQEKKEQEQAIKTLQRLDNKTLATLAEAGNPAAAKILAEREA